MTLEKAVASVLAHNKGLVASRLEDSAAQKLWEKAGARPNPELEIESENLGLASVSIVLNHPIELAGKRTARLRLAELERQRAQLRTAQHVGALRAETHRRFFRALGEQKALEQLDTLMGFAERAVKEMERQVTSGRLGRVDYLRSSKELAFLRLERQTLLNEYQSARTSLAALWGGFVDGVDGGALEGKLETALPARLEDSLEGWVARSYDLHLAAWEVERAEAEGRLVRSEGAPGFSVKGGYLREEEAGANRFVLGLSLGLPFYQRNRAGDGASAMTMQAARLKQEALRAALRSDWQTAIAEMRRLALKAETLKDTILPKTVEVLQELERQLASGKSTPMELAAAQREWAEVWREYWATVVAQCVVMAGTEALMDGTRQLNPRN